MVAVRSWGIVRKLDGNVMIIEINRTSQAMYPPGSLEQVFIQAQRYSPG